MPESIIVVFLVLCCYIGAMLIQFYSFQRITTELNRIGLNESDDVALLVRDFSDVMKI